MLEQYIGYGTTYYFRYKSLEKKNYSIVQYYGKVIVKKKSSNTV